MTINLSEITSGMELPDSKILVIQEHIHMYAEASRDFNPIHIDPEFAVKTEFGGTVAHGMLILAHLSAYMTSNFGHSWMTGGTLNIRFKAAARPGDIITINGKITSLEPADNFTLVSCDVLCRNQKDEAVITGDAKVRMKH